MTETANIAKALAAFQAEMPTVAKSKKATVKSDKGSYSYTYAGLAEVSHAALPLLTRHGLSFACIPEITDGRAVLTGILLHTSGESLRGSLPLATGGTPQQTGSAITYGRRYLFGCMTGLITDDDDDGAAASRKPPAEKPERRAERVKATPPDDPYYDNGPQTLPMHAKSRATMFALFGELKIAEENQRPGIVQIIGREIASRGEISEGECQAVIKDLRARVAAKKAAS